MPLNISNTEDIFSRAINMHAAGKYAEAELGYRQVIQLNPNHSGAFQNLGVMAFQLGRNDVAAQLLQRAIQLAPTNAAVHCNLGDVYASLRNGDEALACYKKAVELDPTLATTYNNLGIVYSRLGKVTEAMESWQKAIELSGKKVGNARVLVGLGGHGKGKSDESKLLAAAAYNNLGNAYLQRIELDKALQCHRKAVELNEDYANARSNMLRDFTHIPNLDPAMLLAEHRKWWDIHAAGVEHLKHNNVPDPARKIRVGFVSADFREHSVAHFLLPIFENIDRSQIDIFCYSGVNHPDTFTQRLANYASGWRSTLGSNDEELSALIQKDGIDILIDMSGHTSDHRLRAFAYKAAPIQVTYLGYPMTTGATVIDYRLTDPISDPVGMTDNQYSEKLFRLPHTMWCYAPPVIIPADEIAPSVRNPSAPFTFGSFNNCSKISDVTFRIWARVLKELPDARMVIKASAMADKSTRDVVEAGFAKEGVSGKQLVLAAQQVSLAEHFAFYGNVDLGLDTYSYCGTTTTCEAMWMNVPVVTLAGNMHISRVGASLLTNVGLESLVANSEDEFVEIAVRLARDPAALASVRKGLRERLQGSPLMNPKQFGADFGNAMRTMWREWCATQGKK